MKGLVYYYALVIVVVLVTAVPSCAQEAEETARLLIEFSVALWAGLVAIAAAFGIARLASAALDGMARQPEVASNIQTAMIIAAALIEGFTFYALFVCQTQNPFN